MINVYDFIDDTTNLPTNNIPYLWYSTSLRGGKLTEDELDMIASSPEYSYKMADKTKRRFEKGESSIATNPQYATLYAANIIKGRWVDGEAAIARDAMNSYRYAIFVLKRRKFPAGEDAMIASPAIWKKYTRALSNRSW